MGMGGVGEGLGEVSRCGLRSSWALQLVTPRAPVGQLSWALRSGDWGVRVSLSFLEWFRGFRILHSDLCCGLKVWKARSCFLEVS